MDDPGGKTPTRQAARASGEHAYAYVKSEKPVVAAIASNTIIGVVKFIAAFLSGSSAMIAEGIHSIVDSMNACILLFGMKRAKRKPDAKHQFGYSRELYFWTLIVGLMLFTLGGGLSIYEGIGRIREIGSDSTLDNPWLNYIVLGLSMAIEGYALWVALRSFNANRQGRPIFRFLKEANDPSLFAVMTEDLADELGLVFAFAGTLLAHLTGNLYFDAVASVLIGALLMSMAFLLLRETKALIIGRGLTDPNSRHVERIVESHEDVERCERLLSLFLGPDDALITIEASFKPNSNIAASIREITDEIISAYPQVKRVFIEPVE